MTSSITSILPLITHLQFARCPNLGNFLLSRSCFLVSGIRVVASSAVALRMRASCGCTSTSLETLITRRSAVLSHRHALALSRRTDPVRRSARHPIKQPCRNTPSPSRKPHFTRCSSSAADAAMSTLPSQLQWEACPLLRASTEGLHLECQCLFFIVDICSALGLSLTVSKGHI